MGPRYHHLLLLGKSLTNVILIKTKDPSPFPQGILHLFYAFKWNRKEPSFHLAPPPSSWSLEGWERWGVVLQHPFFGINNSLCLSSSPGTQRHTGKQQAICNPVTTASNYSFLFNCIIALSVGCEFSFPHLHLFH